MIKIFLISVLEKIDEKKGLAENIDSTNSQFVESINAI